MHKMVALESVVYPGTTEHKQESRVEKTDIHQKRKVRCLYVLLIFTLNYYPSRNGSVHRRLTACQESMLHLVLPISKPHPGTHCWAWVGGKFCPTTFLSLTLAMIDDRADYTHVVFNGDLLSDWLARCNDATDGTMRTDSIPR